MRTRLICVGIATMLALAMGSARASDESAWDAMVANDPELAENASITAIERQILNVLSPDQAEDFYSGVDPSSILLDDGTTLEQYLSAALTPGGVIFVPTDPCILADTRDSVDGNMGVGETRDFLARGLDLSSQGGSATGCGVPDEAVAIFASFRIRNPDGAGNGRLRAWATGDPQPSAVILDFAETADNLRFNAGSVVQLADIGTGDFTVRTTGVGARVTMHTTGYFLPMEEDTDPASDLDCADCVDSTEIVDGSVGGDDIADESVTGADIADDSLDGSEIADGSLGSADLADGSIASIDIADSSILFDDIGQNSCSAGEVMKWDGTAWVCATDADGGVWSVSGSDISYLAGNVGIGTAAPSDALDVAGDLSLSGSMKKDGVRILSVIPVQEVALGTGALANNTAPANTAIGSESLANNTLGTSNTAVGLESLRENVSGTSNTAVGSEALRNVSPGDRNTAIGAGAGVDLTSGDDNVYIANPGQSSESGIVRVGTPGTHTDTYLAGDVHADVFIGDGSGLGSITSAVTRDVDCVGCVSEGELDFDPTTQAEFDSGVVPQVLANDGAGSGLDADLLDGLDSSAFQLAGTDLWVNTTGDSMTGPLVIDQGGGTALDVTGDVELEGDLLKSGQVFIHDSAGEGTAIGLTALESSTGLGNTAAGQAALKDNSVGSFNTGVGDEALLANTSGSFNTAVGENSLRSNTSASENTAVGQAALESNALGEKNTALGSGSHRANIDGNENVAVGAQTLEQNISGSSNIAIGYRSGALADGDSNIYIGNEGASGESGMIRIGTPGTHTDAYLSGDVHADVFIGDGSGLGNITSAVTRDVDCVGCVSEGELDFDPTTQAEFDSGVVPQVLANDGAGSGLDADLLDGLDSSSFQLAGTDLWVNTAGDTMAGTLVLNPASGYALETSSDVDISGIVFRQGAPFMHADGNGSTALGEQSLSLSNTGINNTSVGFSALGSNSVGSQNTAVGWGSLEENTVGTFNSAFGERALSRNTNGTGNTAIGRAALSENTVGGSNTAVGEVALANTIDGVLNTAIGTGSIISGTSGDYNTAIGSFSLEIAEGDNNIALGHRAGAALTNGSDNIHIGNEGVAADSGVIRIGTPGTHTNAYLSGDVHADAFIGDGSGLGNITSTVTRDVDCVGCVSEGELDFDPTTQAEFDAGVIPQVLANDGAGSSLDADLLDGLDSSAFQLAGTDLWVDTAGDTMTGTLTLNPSAGKALEASGDIDLGGSVLKSGQIFLHNSGVLNTALGEQALSAVTTGSSNVAVGVSALEQNSTGGGNTALGYLALRDNDQGSENTALGRSAMLLNTSGEKNTAVGFLAMTSNTEGSQNTAVGQRALNRNTTGATNTAVGFEALVNSTQAGQNTAVGRQALRDNVLGSNNTAVGAHSLLQSTGSGNTAVGSGAMFNGSGSRNVAIGHITGIDMTTGDDNILISHRGVADESDTIRIGTQGTQTKAFMAGVAGVSLPGTAQFVVVDSNGQLGASSADFSDADTLDGLDSSAFQLAGTDLWIDATGDTMTGTLETQDIILGGRVTTSSGLLFLHGDESDRVTAVGADALSSGSPGQNTTAVGASALANNTASGNTAVGSFSLAGNVDGGSNTAVGFFTLQGNTSGSNNTAVGTSVMFENQGGFNTGVGSRALWRNTDGDNNTGIGASALGENTTGFGNTALGTSSLFNNLSGDYNVALGQGTLSSNELGNRNIALGTNAGQALTAGSDNIYVSNPGEASESGTTRIGTQGVQTRAFVAGVSGVTLPGSVETVVVDANGQLGTVTGGPGSGDADTLDGLDSTDFLRSNSPAVFSGGPLDVVSGSTLRVRGFLDGSTATSIAFPALGITGAGPGSGLNADLFDGLDSSAFLTAGTDLWVDTAGDTMTGTLDLSPSSGFALNAAADINVDGDLRMNGIQMLKNLGAFNMALGVSALRIATSTGNTAIGHGALSDTENGGSNTAVGEASLTDNTTGFQNTAVGARALQRNVSGILNVAIGSDSLREHVSQGSNTAVGAIALVNNASGFNNTAIGKGSLQSSITGKRNTAIGFEAGKDSTGDDNVYISNPGQVGESGTVRIGASGSQNRVFVAGVSGVSVASGAPVLIDANGQLGTISSSRRYKEDIQDMGTATEKLKELRPVTYRYTTQHAPNDRSLQYGLIAEEVAEVFPELVQYNEDGQPETVLYHHLTTMLLNELQKQQEEIDELRGAIRELTYRVEDLEPTLPRLAEARP